jgi:hypothetical protein
MAAAVSDQQWAVADIVASVEAAEAPAKKRGPYRKRADVELATPSSLRDDCRN